MRALNKKQKRLLDKWLQENSHLPGLAVCDVVHDYLDFDLWCELQEINDFETIYQATNCYLNDNAMNYNKAANPHFTNELGL